MAAAVLLFAAPVVPAVAHDDYGDHVEHLRLHRDVSESRYPLCVAQATAPILDSTETDVPRRPLYGRYRGISGHEGRTWQARLNSVACRGDRDRRSMAVQRWLSTAKPSWRDSPRHS